MAISLDELSNGGILKRETVTETCLGVVFGFADYLLKMRNEFLDPDAGLSREDLEKAFSSAEDKLLLRLWFEKCNQCDKRLIECACFHNRRTIDWLSKQYPFLAQVMQEDRWDFKENVPVKNCLDHPTSSENGLNKSLSCSNRSQIDGQFREE